MRGLRCRTGHFSRTRSRTVKRPCGLSDFFFRSRPNLGNEIRDEFEPFLLPYTPSTSTRILPLSGSSPARLALPSVALRALDGVPPTETGDPSVSRRSRPLWRIDFALWGRICPNPRTTTIEPLTPLSPFPSIPVCAVSRCTCTDSIEIAKTASAPAAVTRRGFPDPRCLRSTRSALLLVRPLGRRLRTLCPEEAPCESVFSSPPMPTGYPFGFIRRPARLVLRTTRAGYRPFVAHDPSRHAWQRSRKLRRRDRAALNSGRDLARLYIREPGSRPPRAPVLLSKDHVEGFGLL